MSRDRLYLISLAMMVAIVVLFLSAMNYAYSQRSDGVISVLSSSSYTDLNEDDESNYHIVGEVKNTSTDSMTNVKIVATFYDKSRKVVDTDFTYTNIDVLRPAEKSSFEIILNDEDLSQKIDSYKLSLSAEKNRSSTSSA